MATEKKDWKGLRWGYDEIIVFPFDSRECSFCLTIPQVEAILAFSEFMTWKTRWESISNTEISQLAITKFTNDLRVRLMSGCCDDGSTVVLQRINPDTGILEVSTDGGVTWNPSNNDPRVGGIVFPPPVTSGIAATKCDAANNIVVRFISIVTQIVADKDANKTNAEVSTGIASALAAIFGGGVFGAIVAIFGGVISLFLAADEAAIVAAFDSTTWNQFLCAVYCSIGSDGSFDDTSLASLLTQIPIKVASSYAVDCLTGLVRIGGVKFVNNAAAQGSSHDTDCSSCDPCDACTNIDSFNASLPGTLGSVTTRTGAYIEVAAEYYSGYVAYVAQIDSGADHSVCCNLSDFVCQTEGVVPNVYMEECGSDSAVAAVVNHSVHLVWGQATVPFTIRFYFDGA